MTRTTALMTALTVASSLFCPSAPAAPPAPSGAPIKVGVISSLTTVAAFPDSAKGTRAFFDMINREGGINGRKLVLIEEDDQGDPKRFHEVARRLVEKEEVVALVGSASTGECMANAEYYVQQGIASIQGTGVDPSCFNSPNISPVNTGPYVGSAAALLFASQILQRDKICAILMDLPGMAPAYEETISNWSRVSGKTLHLRDQKYPLGSPTAPYVKRALDAKCDAVFFLGLEPEVLDWIKSVKAAGPRAKGVDWLFLTPAYTLNVAQKAGADGEGMYAMSEFLPWSSRALDLTDWRETMNRSKAPLTSFSQGGYLAAQIFVSVIRRIKGEITRQSVLQALHEMKEYDSPLIGTPYAFGTTQRHNSNHAIMPMVLRDGQWRIGHPDWIIVPLN